MKEKLFKLTSMASMMITILSCFFPVLMPILKVCWVEIMLFSNPTTSQLCNLLMSIIVQFRLCNTITFEMNMIQVRTVCVEVARR